MKINKEIKHSCDVYKDGASIDIGCGLECGERGEHTPAPWKYEYTTQTIRAVPANYWVASMNSFDGAVDNKANAEFIVRAVNRYDRSLNTMRGVRNALHAIRTVVKGEETKWNLIIESLDEAINLAEGK